MDVAAANDDAFHGDDADTAVGDDDDFPTATDQVAAAGDDNGDAVVADDVDAAADHNAAVDHPSAAADGTDHQLWLLMMMQLTM